MAVIDSFSQWDDAPRSTLFTVYCRFKGKVRILLFFVYVFVCLCYRNLLQYTFEHCSQKKKVFNFLELCMWHIVQQLHFEMKSLKKYFKTRKTALA